MKDNENKYLKNESNKTVFKITPKGEVYYVQVFKGSDDSFKHARGMIKQLSDNYPGFIPATEKDYIDRLKDYFAIDKVVRDHFIKQYNLQ